MNNIIFDLPNIDKTQSEEEIKHDKDKEEQRKIKHRQYVMTYVKCVCGCDVMRCNMCVHKKTKKHNLLIEVKETAKIIEYEKMREILRSALEITKKTTV